MKKILIIGLLFITCFNFAYSDKKVLLKQAARYSARRNYEKAIELYEQILIDHPSDQKTIEYLINIFIRTSKTKKAKKLLSQKENYISKSLYTKLMLSILLREGKIKKAEIVSSEFLQNNKNVMSFYTLISNIFQQFKQYEFSIKIMKDARKISGNKYLYARELAYAYLGLNKPKEATEEFLHLMEKEKKYSNYVLNKLREILKEDPSIIEQIEDSASSSKNEKIHEIYALCLGDIGEYDKALEEYKNLSPPMLLRFARRQNSFGNLNYALKAYLKFIEKIQSPVDKAEAQIEVAKIHIAKKNFVKAKNILQKVRNEKIIKNRRYRYRTKANVESRELLAKIEMLEAPKSQKVKDLLIEAKQFAINQRERKKLEFSIVYNNIINAEYEIGRSKISKLIRNEDPGSEIYKKGFYYSYLIALMQNDPLSDSLMTEFIINSPKSEEANDVLLLTSVIKSLEDEDAKSQFLTAYRNKLSYQNDAAIQELQNIYENNGNEEMLILAGEWALMDAKVEQAKQLFSRKFESTVLEEYAKLKLVNIKQDKQMVKDFLKTNPQSVFSPEFRKILGY